VLMFRKTPRRATQKKGTQILDMSTAPSL